MLKWEFGGVFSLTIIESRTGYLSFKASGKGVEEAFSKEAGGHRWQGPSGKQKKIHTSTITVAILKEPSHKELKISTRDLEWKTCRGSGAGGQHRNVTDSAVQLKHKPSGLMIRVESERSQHQNKELALMMLRAKLHAEANGTAHQKQNLQRRSQIGGGARGDKTITIAKHRGTVVHHETGKKTTFKRYSRGFVEDLW